MNRFQKVWRLFWICAAAAVALGRRWRRPAKPSAAGPDPERVEKRYTGSQFAAEFLQESTIKTMEITDFASGRLYVRYPG